MSEVGDLKELGLEFKEVLKQYGLDTVRYITICRTPIEKRFDLLIDIISLGSWSQQKEKFKYDDLFHLFAILTLESGNGYLRLEKNERLKLTHLDSISGLGLTELNSMIVADYESGSLNTLDMFLKTLNQYPVKEIVVYDPKTQNCQHFITRFLEANGLLELTGQIGDDENYNLRLKEFINQDAGLLLDELPNWSQDLMRGATNVAALFDFLVKGGSSS